MLLITLILVPIVGIFLIATTTNEFEKPLLSYNLKENTSMDLAKLSLNLSQKRVKIIGLVTSLINL